MANGNGGWKSVVIGVLASLVVAGSATYFLSGSHVPRDDVSRMIQMESPFVAYRAQIATQLDQLTRTVERLTEIVTELDRKVERMDARSSSGRGGG